MGSQKGKCRLERILVSKTEIRNDPVEALAAKTPAKNINERNSGITAIGVSIP